MLLTARAPPRAGELDIGVGRLCEQIAEVHRGLGDLDAEKVLRRGLGVERSLLLIIGM